MQGRFTIELRDRMLRMEEGDMVVIPRNTEHRPVCPDVCCVMLIEPKDTVNTGTTGGDMTDTVSEWI